MEKTVYLTFVGRQSWTALQRAIGARTDLPYRTGNRSPDAEATASNASLGDDQD